MDTDLLKSEIQQAYRDFLARKKLKPRVGQRLMIAELVRNLLNYKVAEEEACQVTVIEAGTGTGKTMAYLLALLPTARFLDKTLVVATATVALQDQLINKDIPDLLANTDLDFSYTLVKGRRRYLCTQKLHNLLHPQQQDETLALWEEYRVTTLGQDDLKRYQALERDFSRGDWNGDRDALAEQMADYIWFPITNDHRGCTGRSCTFFSDCPFYQARDSVHRVDLIVANHDLVLADLAMGGGALIPNPDSVIFMFDEGHHLPDKALGHFATSVQLQSSADWLRELVPTVGKLVDLAGTGSLVGTLFDQLKSLSEALTANLATLAPTLVNDYSALAQATGPKSDRSLYRFPEGRVEDDIRSYAQTMQPLASELATTLQIIGDWLQEGVDQRRPDIGRQEAESWLPVMANQAARAEAMTVLWKTFTEQEASGDVPLARWLVFIRQQQGIDVEMAASPVLARRLLNEHLWRSAFAVVITSATLSVAQSFERFKFRTGVPDNTKFSILPSPFDYAQAGVIRVPKWACDPRDEDRHNQQIIYCLQELLEAPGGILVLFNSRRQMEAVYDSMDQDSQAKTLAQGPLGKAEIVRRHQARIDAGESSMIFGLASFAEGVDLPGNYCTRVVIVRLPFTVPEDPVDATLAEWVKANSGDPFLAISVPDAAIKLKQAVGRLIRGEQDRGEVIILDRRVVERRYGRVLLNSLPPFPLQVEPPK